MELVVTVKENPMRSTITPLTAAVLALGLAAGCQSRHKTEPAAASTDQPRTAERAPMNAADMGPDIKEAIAVLHGTRGNEKVHGTVKFTDTGSGVRIVAHVEGLSANTSHGFHVHEFGDCSAPDGASAGGHFNPTGAQHGAPGAQSHVGDMGNLKSDAAGMAHLELTVPHAAITGKNGIIGRAVIVHGQADDLKSQPSGNAGNRIACGVIGAAQVKKQ
jgi:Cu-Zn family superoxide dismutase